MGTLAHFPLAGIRIYHGIKSFVETGTANGEGVERAIAAGFEVIHSIEIDDRLAEAARIRFGNNPHVRIWHGHSTDILPEVLMSLPPEPCLFWLDAHFPAAHAVDGAAYDAEPDMAKRLPLRGEVEAIKLSRGGTRDILLIDDVRVYEDGPFAGGNLPANWQPIAGLDRSLAFVRDHYEDTHGIVTDFDDQGYMMVFPRQLTKGQPNVVR